MSSPIDDPRVTDVVSPPGLVVPGWDLPPQMHLGRTCTTDWTPAWDRVAVEYEMGVKPEGALWTSPVSRTDGAGRVATPWSDMYYQQAYDARRRAAMDLGQRLRALRPERMWPVVPTAEARIVRLGTVEDVLEAERRWPDGTWRVSWAAMATDGIDGVWVQTGVMPDAWSSSEWDQPNAAVRAQFFGWDVESVAWLRPDNLTIGQPLAAWRKDIPDRGARTRAPTSRTQTTAVRTESTRAGDQRRDMTLSERIAALSDDVEASAVRGYDDDRGPQVGRGVTR